MLAAQWGELVRLGTLAQMAIVIWVIWAVGMPIALWRKLGDAEYVASLDPDLQRAYGVKLYTDKNGKAYTAPPPPLKRLQISFFWGLLLGALLGGAIWLAVRVFHALAQ